MTHASRSELFAQNTLGTKTTLEDVKDTISFLDDWEDRYGYIIELGKQLPGIPEADKTEENYIHGCQSQVWVVHEYDQASGKVNLLVESDALIVKGLAAIVMVAFNGKTPNEIVELDIEQVFADLELLRHLSPTRGNGLRSMVRKIKALAERHL
jgi:cysteine desulfuration protein SufE